VGGTHCEDVTGNSSSLEEPVPWSTTALAVCNQPHRHGTNMPHGNYVPPGRVNSLAFTPDNQSKLISSRFSDPGEMTQTAHPRQKTITNPSTNRARCTETLLMRWTTLTLHLNANRSSLKQQRNGLAVNCDSLTKRGFPLLLFGDVCPGWVDPISIEPLSQVVRGPRRALGAQRTGHHFRWLETWIQTIQAISSCSDRSNSSNCRPTVYWAHFLDQVQNITAVLQTFRTLFVFFCFVRRVTKDDDVGYNQTIMLLIWISGL